MKVSSFLILTPALLLAACGNTPSSPKPAAATVQIAAGTYNVQGNDVPGTSLLLRVKLSDGTAPTQDVPVTITGPSGWNGDQPLVVMYTAGEDFDWFLRTKVAAVAGAYKASAQLEDKTYSATSASVDIAKKLDIPAELAFSEGANQSVTLTWQKVNDAATYLEEVYRVDNEESLSEAYGYTDGLSVNFPESALETNVKYAAIVTAFNAPVGAEDRKLAVFPKQFNTSFGYSAKSITRVP